MKIIQKELWDCFNVKRLAYSFQREGKYCYPKVKERKFYLVVSDIPLEPEEVWMLI